MEKIVTSGNRDCTVVLDGTECSVKFDSCYRAYSVQNNSTSDVFVSVKQGAGAGDDGVMRIKTGCSAVFAHMRLDVDTVYFNGAGEIQIHGQNDTNNSFHNAPAASGGGEAVDAYTKSESDARYAAIADVIPYKMGMDFGTCTTTEAAVTKTVTTLNKVALAIGAVFAIKFVNAVPAQARLTVNGLSGYIQYRGSSLPAGLISAGDIVTFMYYVNTGFNRFEILSIENGGNAQTVNGHTVNADVPENAVFTDTVPDLSGYAMLTDIPSSLPANGGNADTVDGKHASDFALASTSQQVMNSRIELPANVNVGEWLVENAKIGTQYFRTDGAVGQTNLPGGLNTWMWFSYDGNRYFARAWTTDNGTTEFVLNNVNSVGEWKEIAYTPIKSTSFSGTTNEYGNVVFAAVGNKIPIFVECSPYCGIPIRFNDNYWIHCINPITTNNSIVADTVVNGTVYYIEA